MATRPPIESFFKKNGNSQSQTGERPPIESFFKNGVTPPAPNQGQSFGNPILDTLAGASNFAYQGIGNFVKGISQGAEGLSRELESGPSAQLMAKKMGTKPNTPVTDTIVKPLTQGFNNLITQGQQGVSRQLGKSPDDVSTWGGQATGDIASLLYGALKGGKAGGALTKEAVYAKSAPFLEKLGAKLPNFLSRSVGATEGTILTGEGRGATPAEIGMGLGIDSVFGGLGKVGSYLKNKAPNSLYRFGTKLQGSSFAKSEELATRARDLNLVGSRPEIAKRAKDVIKINGEKLATVISGHKGKFDPDKLVNSAVEAASKLEKNGDKSSADAMIKVIDEFRGTQNQPLSANRLLEIKRHAAEKVLPNLEKGEITGALTADLSARKNVWAEIWKNANSLLEGINPKVVKPLNQNMETAYAVLKPTEKLLNKTGNFLTTIQFLQDLVKSPTVTTNLSKGLSKLPSKLNPLVKAIPRSLLLKGLAITEGKQ